MILSVFLMQNSIVKRMNADATTSASNIFLIDIGQDELQGVKNLLAHQPGIRQGMEEIPIISARIATIDGVNTEQLKVKNYPKRLLSSVSVTWADSEPVGVKVEQGKWWRQGDANGLAVVDRVARRLNLHPGSEVVFTSGERTIPTRVTAIFAGSPRRSTSSTTAVSCSTSAAP